MASFALSPSLMGLPGEIRHLIMLQVFNQRNLIILLAPNYRLEEGGFEFRPFFHTAPLLASKQLRSDALAALMQGIELRVDSLCNMQSLAVLPPAIRQCIQYLDSTYDGDCCGRLTAPKDGWLSPSVLEQLPYVESIFFTAHHATRGELSCEIPTVDNEADLRTKVCNGEVVDEIKRYLREGCDIHMDMLSKLERDVVVHVDVDLCSNYEAADNLGQMPDYLRVLATYRNKQNEWSLEESPHHQIVDFKRGCVTIQKRHKA